MPTALLLMLKKSAGVIVNNWKGILFGILITIILYQNTATVRYLFFIETIPSLQTRLKLAEENLSTCIKGNKTLTDVIEDRNIEVTRWKNVSIGLEDKNKKLGIQLLNMRKVTDNKVAKVLKAKTPKSCEASIQYLRDSREDLKWPE